MRTVVAMTVPRERDVFQRIAPRYLLTVVCKANGREQHQATIAICNTLGSDASGRARDVHRVR
jgi:hypothetical protein